MTETDSPHSILDLLTTRRTVPSRGLGLPGPVRGDIETIVAAALRVPDHGKLAPWRYILVEGDQRDALGAFCLSLREARDGPLDAQIAEKERTAFSFAPSILVAIDRTRDHVKIPRIEQHYSVGASVMNAMLAAHALGFSAQWLTGWAAFDPKVHAHLGLEEGETIAAFLHIGTPQEAPVERPRVSVGDVLTVFGETPA